MTSWTEDNQARLDRLRDREHVGALTEPERVELATLIAQVEAEEADALAPAMNRLHQVNQVQHEDVSRAREAEARLKQENSLLHGENARLRAAAVELLRRGEQ